MSRSPLFYFVLGVLVTLAAVFHAVDNRPVPVLMLHTIWATACFIAAFLFWQKENRTRKAD